MCLFLLVFQSDHWRRYSRNIRSIKDVFYNFLAGYKTINLIQESNPVGPLTWQAMHTDSKTLKTCSGVQDQRTFSVGLSATIMAIKYPIIPNEIFYKKTNVFVWLLELITTYLACSNRKWELGFGLNKENNAHY